MRTASSHMGSEWLAASMLLIMACSTPVPVERPVRQPASAAPVTAKPSRPPRRESALYTPEEALRDVLSGELQYLGTGEWPGIERSRACAFRNARVLVVNVYCTRTDTHAFRIDVYSPQRGRARIYAEANGPITIRDRALYFTFMVESDTPPGSDPRATGVALTMSYEELQRYEQRRADALLPGCYGGERNKQAIGGCLGALTPRASRWAAQNRAFLEHANGDWYRVVGQMRALAQQHGVDRE
jgi:hypothetical protein